MIVRLRTLPRPVAVAVGLATVVAALAAAGGLWYVFLRPDGPTSVGSSGPVIPSSSASNDEETDGSWQLDNSIGSFADFSGSWVGYRVQEELAGIGGNTAVGRTNDLSGTLSIAGSSLTAASITADLSGLVSDDERRDDQLRRQALETDLYPTATFELNEPIEIPETASDGDSIQVTARGDLTVHGVTHAVDIPLNVRYEDGVMGVAGSLEIAFADYGIEQPTSFLVLSVDDHGTIELQLFFTHA
jgi:polyisoprenoid-binding protein YceI